MQTLNEAFISSIMKQYWNNVIFKTVFIKLNNPHFSPFPALDINLIQDSMFQKMKPSDAFKIHAKVFKFWVKPNGVIDMVTYSNSWFDQYFETNKRKRNAIICVSKEAADGWINNGNVYVTKQAYKECLVFDPEKAITMGANKRDIEATRKNARAGATALMTDSEIRKMNIKRFKDILSKNKVSDGSEFALINNYTKIVKKSFANNGLTGTLLMTISQDWVAHYLEAYDNELFKYIDELNKNGFLLPKVELDRWEAASSHEYNFSKMRKTLENAITRIDALLNKNKEKSEMLKHFDKQDDIWFEFVDLCASAGIDRKLITEFTTELIEMGKDYEKVINNSNITSSLLNFDAYVSLLRSLSDAYNSRASLNNFIYAFNFFTSLNKADREKYKETLYKGDNIDQSCLMTIKRMHHLVKQMLNIK